LVTNKSINPRSAVAQYSVSPRTKPCLSRYEKMSQGVARPMSARKNPSAVITQCNRFLKRNECHTNHAADKGAAVARATILTANAPVEM
jgi:hypothetical protein